MDLADSSKEEVVLWQGYAAWSQFIWLYFVACMMTGRAAFMIKLSRSGWNVWLIGALSLLGCAAALRRWGRYVVTSKRILLRNGWTGRDIQAIELSQVSEVSIKQGPLADLMGIGTVAIRSRQDDAIIHFRGVFDPEEVTRQIQVAMVRRPA